MDEATFRWEPQINLLETRLLAESLKQPKIFAYIGTGATLEIGIPLRDILLMRCIFLAPFCLFLRRVCLVPFQEDVASKFVFEFHHE